MHTPRQQELIQRAFDIAAPHLLKQKRKSLNGTSGPMANEHACMYRGEDGCMCGIGPIIHDNLYNIQMEGQSPGLGVDDWGRNKDALNEALATGLRCEVEDVPYNFLWKLQGIHDSSEPRTWHRKLLDLAADNGLTTDCIASA